MTRVEERRSPPIHVFHSVLIHQPVQATVASRLLNVIMDVEPPAKLAMSLLISRWHEANSGRPPSNAYIHSDPSMFKSVKTTLRAACSRRYRKATRECWP